MKMWHALLLFLCAFVLTAAANSNPCDEARLKGNRYFGAMRAALGMGAVDISAVELAVRSAEPYDALAHVTPEKHQIVAKHLFAELVHDPDVRARWNETKVLLAHLLDQEQSTALIRGAAERATKRVLAPRETYAFDRSKDQHETPFARLPDGRVVIARTSVPDGKELVITTSDGRDILRKILPGPESDMRRFGWHRDATGSLWLYTVSGNSIYRMRWGTDQFEEVPMDRRWNITPSWFRSVGPGHMYLITMNWSRLNVAGDSAVQVNLNINPNPQGMALDRNGNVETRLNSGVDGGSQIVYSTKAGETYHIDGASQNLTYRRADTRDWQLVASNIDRANQVSAAETDDGRLLVAHLSQAGENGILRVFAPLESKDPIYMETYAQDQTLAWNPRVQWLRGPRGELLLGIPGATSIYFADPRARKMTEVTIPEGTSFSTWFAEGDQAFFSLREGNNSRIFDVNAEVRP